MTDKPKTTRKAAAEAVSKRLPKPHTERPAAAKPGPVGRTAAEMAKAPTIGRIVHVYDHSLGVDGHAGRGFGPYAAIITHVRPAVPGKPAVEPKDADHGTPAIEAAPEQLEQPESVDVVLFAPEMGGGHERGALPYRDGFDRAAPLAGVHRYWTWPPRDGAGA